MISSVQRINTASSILRKIFSVTSILMKYYEVLALAEPEAAEAGQHFGQPEGEAAAFAMIMKIPLPAYSAAERAAAGNNMRKCRKKARMPNITYLYLWKNQYSARTKRFLSNWKIALKILM